MEDVDRRLSVLERSVPTIGWKKKMSTGMTDEEWNLLDRKALGTVRLCLAASVTFNISK